jgi:murein DD-endopeptidase MepM/ murein hydrolase activator NlpD
MTDLLRWGGVRLLDRGRRLVPPLADQVGRLPRGLRQHGAVALGLAAAAGAAGSVYCGAEAIHYQRAAVAERAAAQTEIAQLRDELGGTKQALNAARDRLGDVNDEAQHKIAASEQAVSSNADRVAQLTRKLDQAQRALHLAEAQRATLMARLSRSEVEAAQDQIRRQEGVRGDLEQLEKKLRQLAAEREKIEAERDKAAGERDRLRSRVGELEEKLSQRQARQLSRSVASARPAPAVPPMPARETEPQVASLPPLRATPETREAVATSAPTPAPAQVAATPAPVIAAQSPVSTAVAAAQPAAPAIAPAAVVPIVYASAAPQVQRPAAPAPAPVAVPAVSHGGIAQVERVLASAGVDVKNLFSQFGVNRGLGGPYIPNPRGSTPESMSAEKILALGRMVKSLPVGAPLHSYDIGSRFGVRGDPINGHAALHTGTDLRAPYMSPVYATAAGIVTFSGYRDDYGKIVEIDHGYGLVTRYGHLNRTTVSVGQRVAAQTQIGFLGSTGRATGPHVHYEVVVNGEPQDAEKFMALGRIVSVVAQR